MCAAVEVSPRFHTGADHLHATVLTGGSKGVDSALKAVEGARLAPRHTYLEGLRVQYINNKPTDFNGSTHALECVYHAHEL